MDKPFGRPMLYKTAEELEKRINEYYDRCEEKEIPLTISGLAVWLGMNRRTLTNYSHREKFGYLIEEARNRIEASMEEKMLMNKINVTGAIFALKNHYKWTDRQEVQTTNENINKNYDLSGLSKEEIKELLKNE